MIKLILFNFLIFLIFSSLCFYYEDLQFKNNFKPDTKNLHINKQFKTKESDNLRLL